jgi:hypothetical protein
MKIGFLYRATPLGPIASSLSTLHYVDNNFPGRAGWKEIIAVGGSGTALESSSVPSRDRSVALSNYPTDLLHSPPQTLVADVTFRALLPGTHDESRPFETQAYSAAGVKLTANQQATPRNAFTELINSNRTDFAFLTMAAFIAAILGGFHAFEPGHGKTLVAALSCRLARDGTPRGVARQRCDCVSYNLCLYTRHHHLVRIAVDRTRSPLSVVRHCVGPAGSCAGIHIIHSSFCGRRFTLFQHTSR